MDTKTRRESLIAWIKAEAAAARGLLVPVSGGTDSALVFWLANAVYGDKTTGVFAGDRDKLRGRDWFERTGKIQYASVSAGTGEDLDDARWYKFHVLAKQNKQWLVGSRTRTESLLGTFSLSSRLATFLPLAGVWKSDVMTMGKDIGIPDEILSSSRRADPECGRPPEMSEIPLESIDLFLRAQEGEATADQLSALLSSEQQYLGRVLKQNSFRQKLPACGPLV